MRKLRPVGRQIRRPIKTIKEIPGEVREVEVIKEVVREVPVEVEKIVERIVYRDRPDPAIFDEPELGPPPEFAEFARDGEAYGDTAARLAQVISELNNKRLLAGTHWTEADEAKDKRLGKALKWWQGKHSIEVT